MPPVSMPPQHPTSSTALPASGAWPSIHSSRSGLMSCSGRNSPCGSHQRAARRLNFSISAGSAFTMAALSQNKKPRTSGVVCGSRRRLRRARADHFDLDAAVGLQAFDQLRAAVVAHALALVAADRLLLALALGVDPVLLGALRHQVPLDGVGAPHREALVVDIAAEPVGVAG